MSDQPQGTNVDQNPKQDRNQAPPPSPPQQQRDGTADHNQGNGQQPTTGLQSPSNWKKFWGFFSKSEWVMVFLTAVIALTGVVGIIMVIRGGSDTQKMIKAAQQQADAAEGFAQAARGVNTQVQQAVVKLQSQVDQMDASRKSADRNSATSMQATIDNFHKEDRAWVGISNAKPLRFTPNAATRSANMLVAFTLRNYGHSAANNVRFLAVLESDPTIVSLSCDEVAKIHAGEVLLPTQEHTLNWAMNLTSDQIAKGWSHQNPALGQELVLRIVGCIEYTDRNGENLPHRTPFSYLVMWQKGYITLNTTIPGEEISLDSMLEEASSSQTR